VVLALTALSQEDCDVLPPVLLGLNVPTVLSSFANIHKS
jgi:hypothetical protein